MGDQSSTGTTEQFGGDGSGANLRTNMSNLPPPSKTPPPPKKEGVTVRLSKEQKKDLEMVAEVWNAVDAALGSHRPRKWELTSVMRQFIANGLDLFWGENTGLGRPTAEKERKAFVAAAVKLALRAAAEQSEQSEETDE
jgi:hypothetical protein